jgi:hypothetical protein
VFGFDVVGVTEFGGVVDVVTEDDDRGVLATDVDFVGSVVREAPEHAVRRIAPAAKSVAAAADLWWFTSVLPPARAGCARSDCACRHDMPGDRLL